MLTYYQLTPQILKPAVTEALIGLLEPIRAEFEASSEWQEIEKKAYPSTKPEDKKKKKEKKDKGSRYPGAGKPADGSPALPERGAAEPTGDDPQTLPERVKE